MKRQNVAVSKAHIWVFGSLGVLCAFLVLAAASAQQDRRTDKSSSRDDAGQRPDALKQVDQQQPRATANQNPPSAQNQAQARSTQPQAIQPPATQPQAIQPPATQPQAIQPPATQPQATQPQATQPQPRDQAQRSDVAADRASRPGFRQRLGLQLNRAGQGQPGQGQSGIAITEVQPGSPAAQAGLRSGDQLLTIDGRNLTSPQQFFAYLSGQYGRQVPVVIIRDGRQYTVQLAAENNDDTAWLGVYLNDSETAQGGAEIAQVYPAGPASRAGLRTGDIVTQVEGQSVGSAADLIAAIEEQQAGSRVKFAVTRNNQQVEIPVTLGSRDSFVYRGQGEESYDGRRDDSQYGEQDQFSNLPPFAMQLEHERRMYEQHQRIETEIAKLQDEIKQLRELIQQQQRR